MQKTEQSLKLKIVNAICGSGKSYKLKQYIKNNPDKRILIAVPTHELASQTQSDLQKLGIPAYHNQVDNGESATRSLINALDDDFGRNIVIVTHECLLHFCLYAYRDEKTQNKLHLFDIYIDEIPTAWYGAEVDYKNEEYRNSNFPFLGWLEERDGLRFVRHEDREKFLAYYQSEHANSKLLKQALFALLTGQGMLLEEDKYFFSFTANPILYSALWAKSFTVLGANVGISEFAYAAKTILNAEISLADDELQPDLMRRVHTDTKRIELIPVFNQKCTKKLLSENYSDILNGTRRALRDGFIYTSNNDEQYSNGFYYASHADDVLEGGERVSMASYGLNHYQHLNKAAFLGCANLDKTTIGHWRKYCDLNGWDWRELEEKRQAALNYEKVYQFVSRCSVRVRGNNNKQVYIIPDVGCAEYLKQHYFPDAVIKPAMIKAERKKRDTSKGDSKLQLIKGLLDEGYKQSQIIAITGFKENSVKGYLKRIRKAA
ncbi:DEAD/DEAH box helicase family protein [Escherichia coli]|uniref:DEAD/DEAH box helicase family protein n=1 Tax=Escherichia coli TaxID=562 RepID=UPI0006922A0C|nr:DEAD/DEAH box helicase family protein [Escherichia coli]EFB3123316.1 DEAD/DEAH box helicase [Escherichia coli]EFG5482097.1 DEAD/DEAH box helicase family protein [Escherichia coli]EFP0183540.1 DEAD/DEAH box helicase family protein [Escherichia coli]EIM6783768.1 DEAD/DEAH box helicase family protein [Escherichia coli]EIZ4419121.1 DEAD/DEAH box helicase family protein [Escherichia coli]